MMISTYFIFLLTAILTCMTAEEKRPPPSTLTEINECGLVGKWRNQLNSTLQIDSCKDGKIEGNYISAVGKAKSSYGLTGMYTRGTILKTTIAIAWTVAYNNEAFGNSGSVCAWSGVYYDEDGKIYTHWILSEATERKNYWESKHINSDTFERIE